MNKENVGDYFNNLDEEGKTNPKGIKERLTNQIHKISTLRAKDIIDLKDGRLQENTKTYMACEKLIFLVKLVRQKIE